ncbi:zinc finger protein 92-like [Procambarus clarkii]|uniref:zinc finger protein 92-like n=1 Tax=Procambarus clarkii TaxID=6728 RepID=UPI0037444359
MKTRQCPQCGKVLTRLGSMKRHMLVHSGDKPYECPECGKRFRQLVSMKRHTLVHSGDKPYECPECGKRFNQLGNMKTHRMLHGDERPLECAECGKKFRERGTIIKHIDSRVEILSKVHKHLKAGEKQESEAQDTKESEVVAAIEKEDKGSDGESNAGKLNISFLTVKMRALEINREIEWKKLEIEQEIKEKEMAMKEKEIEKEREMKEKEMEMKRLELEEKEKERQEREKERLHELEVLRLGGQRKTTLTSSFDPLCLAPGDRHKAVKTVISEAGIHISWHKIHEYSNEE